MRVLLVLVAAFSCAIALTNKDYKKVGSGRITTGNEAALGQFPHHVAIYISPNGAPYGYRCGGTILSRQWIMTAGYCVGRGDFKVRAGITQLEGDSNTSQDINVVRTIVHPDYNGGANQNDISLMRLERPLSFNQYVQPIDLPEAGESTSGTARISGWGQVSNDDWPNSLQFVDVEILTNTACENALVKLYGNYEPYGEEANICTGPLDVGVTSCIGDSGGALVQDGKAIGHISWGIQPCGVNGVPTFYTRISSYIDFIKQYVEDL